MERASTIEAEVDAPGAANAAQPTAPRLDARLRRADESDLPRLGEVLADAFYEDPVLSWLMPNDRRRRAQLRRYFGIELRRLVMPAGVVWTTGELAGAALTLPPGAWRSPLHVTLLEGSAFGPRIPRAARVGAAIEWHHLREPHYYVRDVGVDPARQGQGLGSALLAPTLARCDRERLPAYLEASSERNAALYERHGFRVTRELRVGSSPPLRLMRRPPAGAT